MNIENRIKGFSITIISILCASLYSNAALAASFDCSKASTWVEKTICSTPELSMLDDDLAKRYEAEIEDAKDNPNNNVVDRTLHVRKNQMEWLVFQRNTCKDKACLIREYKERLGGKPKMGVAFNYLEDIAPTKLPKPTAFGQFTTATRISIYNFDAKNTENEYEIIDETNSLDVLSVAKKPYLAVIDGNMIFDNAHMCSIADQLAQWSENHWILNSSDLDEPAELRLYPAMYQGKAQILIRDIDQQYRRLSCGMRGHFDGMRLEKVR